jgi:hypothetical protein
MSIALISSGRIRLHRVASLIVANGAKVVYQMDLRLCADVPILARSLTLFPELAPAPSDSPRSWWSRIVLTPVLAIIFYREPRHFLAFNCQADYGFQLRVTFDVLACKNRPFFTPVELKLLL